MSLAAMIASFILEGVVERFPTLRLVVIEGGFGWVPSLGWRMDSHWPVLRSEVPHLTRKPSEYLKSNFWFTTQPIEEPENPEHLRRLIDWIGWDRLLFATDYPHWDSDDPRHAFKCRLSEAERRAIFAGNAKGALQAVTPGLRAEWARCRSRRQIGFGPRNSRASRAGAASPGG